MLMQQRKQTSSSHSSYLKATLNQLKQQDMQMYYIFLPLGSQGKIGVSGPKISRRLRSQPWAKTPWHCSFRSCHLS